MIRKRAHGMPPPWSSCHPPSCWQAISFKWKKQLCCANALIDGFKTRVYFRKYSAAEHLPTEPENTEQSETCSSTGEQFQIVSPQTSLKRKHRTCITVVDSGLVSVVSGAFLTCQLLVLNFSVNEPLIQMAGPLCWRNSFPEASCSLTTSLVS